MSKELNNIIQNEAKQLSNYNFTETIGQGNFGKVKLAIFKPTKELFAVKIITKEQIQIKNEMNLVQRELKIIKDFDHFNVIYVHQIIEDKRNYYIIMDYCENGELFDYIASKQHLAEEESAFLFYQLINGVEYIHYKNIVHRDLKPENLLLTKNRTLKIIDFGLSRHYGNDTILSTKCGSPSYAAPEIIKSIVYDGYKTDVWCCGIILYAMLCGYLPFEGENNQELFKTIIEGKIHFPAYVSVLGRKMIKEMLNPNPNKRIVISEIKTRQFYLKGKVYAELFFNKRKKKIKALHIVNSNSDINAFRKTGLPIATMTKVHSPKNESMCSKIANILKTDTIMFHNIKNIGFSNNGVSNDITLNQLSPKDSLRLFKIKMNSICPLKQILKNKNKNTITSKNKTNMIIMTIPDKSSHKQKTMKPKKELNTSSNSHLNLHTMTHSQGKNTKININMNIKINNHCLPTEPKEFDEFLKIKFKKYINTKSNLQKKERKTTLEDSLMVKSKSKEDNVVFSNRKANYLPKLINC